jgi:hypothetical protein
MALSKIELDAYDKLMVVIASTLMLIVFALAFICY